MENLTWNLIREKEKDKDYFRKLVYEVQQRRLKGTVLPESKNLMLAYKLCPFERTKIVILGQDPYPNAEFAHGLAFSSMTEKTPESLKNIFEEISRDLYKGSPIKELFQSNNLTSWAEQGVLLINSIMTVDEGLPGSHEGIGWEIFTRRMLDVLSRNKKGVVYMLWGKKAQEYENAIEKKDNLILTTSHPSPLSVNKGFVGCGHFGKAIDFLEGNFYKKVIDIFAERLLDKKVVDRIHKAYEEIGVGFQEEAMEELISFITKKVVTIPAMFNNDIEKIYSINFKIKNL